MRNVGLRTLPVQVRAFSWRQDDGIEQLLPTEDVALSPSIMEIPPQGQQIVRILRLAEVPDSADRSFRLVIDELPSEQEALREGAVSVRLRLVVPLFDRAPLASPPRLNCFIQSRAQALHCRNSGGQAAKLSAVSFESEATERQLEINRGLLGYLLPGSEMRWELSEVPESATGWFLSGKLNGQAVKIGLGNEN